MNKIVLRRPDGSERHVAGYKFKDPHPDTRTYDGSTAPADLPKKVDLRPHMTDVEDQKQTNSCAANAIAGAYEYLVKRHSGEPYDVSRMFIYWNGRAAEGSHIADEGMAISDAIASLKQYGAPSEASWPFDEKRVNTKPSTPSYSEAKNFLVEDAAVVPTDLTAWKQVLAEGYPIVFGVKLFDSFDKQRKPGMVPSPTANETGRSSHGGHAMVCVGYSDPDSLFIVRNSWGPDWGDQGYCYIPYSYLMNEELNFGDSWIIRQEEGFEGGEDTWIDNDESVLEELDHELANMSDEDYQAMVDAMGSVSLEERVATIFLQAANAGSEATDEQLDDILSYVTTVLEAIGSRYSPKKVLKHARKHLDDEKLLKKSIKLLGEHLSSEVLASITTHLQTIVDEGDEDDSDEEEEEEEDESDEEDDSDEEEEEEEEDESDEDEDDEDEGDQSAGQAFVDSLIEAWQVGAE